MRRWRLRPDPGGGSISVNARLWWWADGAELGLEVSVGEGEYRRSYGTTDGDKGPAPASAVAELPARAVRPPVIDPVRPGQLVADTPDAGEPFGLGDQLLRAGLRPVASTARCTGCWWGNSARAGFVRGGARGQRSRS